MLELVRHSGEANFTLEKSFALHKPGVTGKMGTLSLGEEKEEQKSIF